MKKVLSIVMAMMLVAALSVNVFADIDLTAGLEMPLNANMPIEIPAGVDVSDGATVTVTVKGTSDNTAIRFYLTDAVDNGRVNEVVTVEVVDGAFEATFDMVIDCSGAVQGTAAPTHFMVKGPDWQTAIANTTFEVLSFVGVDAPVVEEPTVEEPATEEPAPEEPADEPVAEEPADTGLVLALVPAAVALAVVAFKKR